MRLSAYTKVSWDVGKYLTGKHTNAVNGDTSLDPFGHLGNNALGFGIVCLIKTGFC